MKSPALVALVASVLGLMTGLALVNTKLTANDDAPPPELVIPQSSEDAPRSVKPYVLQAPNIVQHRAGNTFLWI